MSGSNKLDASTRAGLRMYNIYGAIKVPSVREQRQFQLIPEAADSPSGFRRVVGFVIGIEKVQIFGRRIDVCLQLSGTPQDKQKKGSRNGFFSVWIIGYRRAVLNLTVSSAPQA